MANLYINLQHFQALQGAVIKIFICEILKICMTSLNKHIFSLSCAVMPSFLVAVLLINSRCFIFRFTNWRTMLVHIHTVIVDVSIYCLWCITIQRYIVRYKVESKHCSVLLFKRNKCFFLWEASCIIYNGQ